MKIKKTVPILLAAIIVMALALTGCSKAGGEYGSFTAYTLDGGTFRGRDIASKDLTVINFWGTFCSPCIAEMPDLAAFEKSLPDNVQLITICVDAQGNEETAKFLLDQAGYTGITLPESLSALKLKNNRQVVCFHAVVQETIVPDFLKTGRQDVHQIAADEFNVVQCNGAFWVIRF